jgi:hypothetical protein
MGDAKSVNRLFAICYESMILEVTKSGAELGIKIKLFIFCDTFVILPYRNIINILMIIDMIRVG